MSYRALTLLTLILALTAALYSQNLELVPDRNHGVSINAGSIRGTLATVDNHPVVNARVELRDMSNGSTVLTTYTRENGLFELYNIRPGDYEVVASLGVTQTHQHVLVNSAEAEVSMIMTPPEENGKDSGATVSIATMKVPDKAHKEFKKADDAFRKNKLDEARKHAENALSIYPNYAEALVLRGILSANDQKLADAEKDLQQAIKVDPSYGMGYIAMAAMMNGQKKFADAVRELEQGIRLSPNCWQAYFEMSKAKMGLDDFENALKNVDRASTLANEEYPPIHLLKAHALLGLKRYDLAVAELEQFLTRDPKDPNAQSARVTLDEAKAFAASSGQGK